MPDFEKYILGCLPSPHDSRDYKINKFFAPQLTFPDEYRIPEYIDEVYDQGYVGSCVAFSLKTIKEYQELRERKVWEKYSAGFIYLNRFKRDDGRGSHQHTHFGEGMYPRDALKSLQLDGVCKHELFPYNVSFYYYEKYPIPYEAFAQAKPQRIAYYFAVDTVEEIKTALMQNGAVLFCIPVYENFYNTGKDGIVPIPSGNIKGYHAMVVVGWRKDNRWIVQNSWGKEWGDNGYCYYRFDYPKSEAWGITDAQIKDQIIELWVGKKDVKMNGVLIQNKLDQPPIVDNKTNRTLVPLRAVAELFGKTVIYHPEDKRIEIIG